MDIQSSSPQSYISNTSEGSPKRQQLASRGFRSLAFTPSLVDRENSRTQRSKQLQEAALAAGDDQPAALLVAQPILPVD
eukprot:CAMPEP_0117681346 /NCGR_PEP_ID=MMETSP0804-20121206/18923_1 /TAXON_ID=1074897 /ORGANISM="Tetraselmis astigmatica, Strain CCMP880" /LENGTH=78 /DNA_ID=CAMNT_0005491077 /DNA_START=425 /DNA_END=661 /DNA_ORIENTATION=-